MALCGYSVTSVFEQENLTTENTKKTQRNTEKTRSLQLAACSLKEEISTVKTNKNLPQRRDCIYNTPVAGVSIAAEGAEELAFRACELLLN